jgi:hypothetical protein
MAWLGALWIFARLAGDQLSPEQIERIRSVGQIRSVQAGEVLYEPSHRMCLCSSCWKVTSRLQNGEDGKILAVREVNQFTGEMSVSAGKRSLLKARVAGNGCGRARR